MARSEQVDAALNDAQETEARRIYERLGAAFDEERLRLGRLIVAAVTAIAFPGIEAWAFRKHAHRMDYPAYCKQGWQIGSGPVEAACETVVAEHLKCSEMR